MRKNWIIQDGILDNQNEIVRCLDYLNIDWMVVDGKESIRKFIKPSTFLYGSVEFIEYYQFITDNQFLAHIPNYAVSEYSKHFGSLYINHDYQTTTLEEIVKNRAKYENIYGRYAFIKPDSGKFFTGSEFELLYLESESFYRENPSQKVIISECREIYAEYRLVIIDNNYIAGSQYKNNEGIYCCNSVPLAVLSYAQHVLETVKWRPNRAFTLDIFHSRDIGQRFFVGEINAINCSHFYKCDIMNIIETINEKI